MYKLKKKFVFVWVINFFVYICNVIIKQYKNRMSKEGFDIANRVSKKKFSFRSFIKTEKMKTQNTKRNRVEKMVFYSILSIYSFITFGGIIVILRNINEVSFNF